MPFTWNPMYLASGLFQEKPPKAIVTSDEWNALVGSLVEQGKYNTDAIVAAIENINSLTTSGLVADTIETIHLKAGAVTQAKLALLSVGTPQLIDGSVTAAKLDTTAGAISGAALADGAIVEAKLGTGAVAEAKLLAGSVSTLKIKDEAITLPKLSPTLQESINSITGKAPKGYGGFYRSNTVGTTVVGSGSAFTKITHSAIATPVSGFSYQNNAELKCLVAGTYLINYNINGTTLKKARSCIFVNNTAQEIGQALLDASADTLYWCLASTAIITLAVNDVLTLGVRNDTLDGTVLGVSSFALSVSRLN